MSDVRTGRRQEVRRELSADQGGLAHRMASEYPVKYIQMPKRRDLRRIAKLSRGKALIRALFDYFIEESSEGRGRVFDKEIGDLAVSFEEKGRSTELQEAFALMRELVDGQYLSPVMQEEFRNELNHVIGGG